MSQMNIVRRASAIPTRLIIIVTCASAAGMMVLGVVLYVLIRCHTKGKRRTSGAFSDANIPHVEHANSEESFIQSAPLRFPEFEPAFTFPLTQEHRRRSLPFLHGIPDNISLRNSMRIPRTSANLSSSGRAGGALRRNQISPRSQVSQESQDSVYSNVSLPLSQYSLRFSSDNPASLSNAWPYLSPIPGSPHETDTSLPSGEPDISSRESIVQPKRKPTEGTSYTLSPPTSRIPSHISLSSASTPIRSSSLSANMLQDSDHLTALPPAGFRRRRSQPNTDPEMYSSHHNPPTPACLPILEISPENSGKIGPLSTSHPRSQSPQRKAIIPEPLRLSRPPEDYASVLYARSRGPEAPSVKGRSSVNAFPPAVSAARGGGAQDTQGMRNSAETFKDKITTFNESSSVFQLSRRPAVPTPTWSTFRNSPGWV